jgi:hypothetical protein
MNLKTNILSKIKELFAEQQMMEDYTAATNEIIRCLGGSLAVGEKVAQVIGGVETDLPDGNYLLNNGKTISTIGNVIKEINEYRAEENLGKTQMESDAASSDQKEKDPAEEKMEDYKNEILTKLIDGTEVRVLSKGEALSVGDKVEVKDAEGNFTTAPAGKHELEGGLVIYLDELGLINELETKETDETTESEEMKVMFEAVSQLTLLVEELKKSISNVNNENKELKEKFNKFSTEPSEKSVTKKQANLSKFADKIEKAKFFGRG